MGCNISNSLGRASLIQQTFSTAGAQCVSVHAPHHEIDKENDRLPARPLRTPRALPAFQYGRPRCARVHQRVISLLQSSIWWFFTSSSKFDLFFFRLQLDMTPNLLIPRLHTGFHHRRLQISHDIKLKLPWTWLHRRLNPGR
jgi:hypothetical protein